MSAADCGPKTKKVGESEINSGAAPCLLPRLQRVPYWFLPYVHLEMILCRTF